MLPKAGSVKILFGNMLEGEASITIDKKTVKVAAGAGFKEALTGPTLEIAARQARRSRVQGGWTGALRPRRSTSRPATSGASWPAPAASSPLADVLM